MQFQVKGVRGRDIVKLDLAANHAEDAMAQAKASGLTPLSATPIQNNAINSRRNKFPLSLFTQELLALIDAGLNLVEAIEGLAEKETRSEVKVVIDRLLNSLHQGQTFSTALADQSNIFPTLYIATVKASEKSGDLSEALTRYVAYDNQIDELKKKIISASIYPVILIMVGGLVILFLLGFVVPKFSTIYEGATNDLPWLSRVLMSWGQLLANNGQVILIGAVVAILLLVYAFTQPVFKRALMRIVWKVPAFGERLKMYQYARFYRTLGMLLKGGTSILPAIQSARGLLDDALQAQMQSAEQDIAEGKMISAALEQAGLTTPVGLRMLRVGERGGNIDDMMARIASFYDEALSRWIDWFTKLFEPILMLVIGLVIGLVVLLLYMPIFELAGSIQ